MTNKSKNIAAFPIPCIWSPDGQHVSPYQSGMTLRDYFAAAALPAIITDIFYEGIDPPTADMMAKYCYDIADSMLKERAKCPT